MQWLIQKNADYRQIFVNGHNLLHIAVYRNANAVVMWLIANHFFNIGTSEEDINSDILLQYAEKGSYAMVQWLTNWLMRKEDGADILRRKNALGERVRRIHQKR